MNEKDFWTKFFQSYYFRRDQINSTTNDFFADCSVKDNDEFKFKEQSIINNPIIVVDSQKELYKEDVINLSLVSYNKNKNRYILKIFGNLL